MSQIVRVEASGAETMEAVEKMTSVLGDTPIKTVLCACLTMAFVIQHPFISPENLIKGVSDISAWMSTYLDDLGDDAPVRTH